MCVLHVCFILYELTSVTCQSELYGDLLVELIIYVVAIINKYMYILNIKNK